MTYLKVVFYFFIFTSLNVLATNKFVIVKNFNLNNKMIAKAAALVDADKLSYKKAAEKWLD